MWSSIKSVGSWLKDKWTRFEAWVYTWMPGLKTKVVTGLGVIGSVSAYLQQYVSGLPLDKFMNATQLVVLTAVLFSLAFWFHGMGGRVEEAAE